MVTALLLSFIVGPMVLRRLRGQQFHQVVRAGTPESHLAKKEIPTMGGIIILISGVVPTLLWAKLDNRYVILALVVTVWMGVIGFLDDYLKMKQRQEGRKNEGLIEKYKLIGQISIGLFLGWYLWQYPISTLPGASTTLPFYKYMLAIPLAPWLAWTYVVFVTFVLTAFSNGVNLTDGLDGLAAGTTAITVATLAIFAYIIGRIDYTEYLGIFYMRGAGELTIFCSALFGACLGFLWFNSHPAQVFMGDTGALALGGAIGSIAILLKSEFLLLIVGGVFVAETTSVMIQRTVFRYRRKKYGMEHARAHRVFLRAPLHHHFEEKGLSEQKIVVRFWIVAVLCAFVALSTLKLR